MAEHNYKFNVTMTCGGCSGAIERVLKKLEGVKDFDVSLDSQTATVKTEDSVDYATVLEKIKKTGKTVNSGEADGVPQNAEYKYRRRPLIDIVKQQQQLDLSTQHKLVLPPSHSESSSPTAIMTNYGSSSNKDSTSKNDSSSSNYMPPEETFESPPQSPGTPESISPPSSMAFGYEEDPKNLHKAAKAAKVTSRWALVNANRATAQSKTQAKIRPKTKGKIPLDTAHDTK
ncbi:hypothetical protein KC316_g4266 [Hortaea werneckii]|nr:hypothetical protein KC324_g4264 [Hortaea werneckii]KAI7588836.1 hypothetical protein KC316_g4266 [Hortaea werneckii]